MHPLEIVGMVVTAVIFITLVALAIALIRWLNASRKAKGNGKGKEV